MLLEAPVVRPRAATLLHTLFRREQLAFHSTVLSAFCLEKNIAVQIPKSVKVRIVTKTMLIDVRRPAVTPAAAPDTPAQKRSYSF